MITKEFFRNYIELLQCHMYKFETLWVHNLDENINYILLTMHLFFSKINFVCDVLEFISVGSVGSQANNSYSSSQNLELSFCYLVFSYSRKSHCQQ